MAKPLKIYIAGPYTAETAEQRLANVNVAIDAGLAVYFKGHFPYVPHLTHFVDERANDTGLTMKWEDYIRWDLPWVRACDALLYLRSSRGADLELQAAKDTGKAIFYSIEEIPVANHDDSVEFHHTTN
ncbi:MAG TPA: DUF4406 domain-containing protein [Pyrinomonadaceae bacterium]|jgi:hypothetical protein